MGEISIQRVLLTSLTCFSRCHQILGQVPCFVFHAPCNLRSQSMVRTEAVARPRTLACTLLSVSLAAAATEATVSAAGAASVAAAAPWAQGGFTESAMANVSAVREQIKALPFLQELVAGTLPEASFAFYLTQDSLYLRQYSKVLAALASRAPTVAVTQNMARAADMALVVEGALHEGFLSSLSELSAEERRRTEPSPTCAAYTDYQQSRLAFSPYEVAFAAALPCYTIYAEVGRHILSITQGAELDANPYKAWVQTYGGQDFEEATARAVAALDELAEGTTMAVREEMLRAFRQSISYTLTTSSVLGILVLTPYTTSGSLLASSGCSGTVRIGRSSGRSPCEVQVVGARTHGI